MKKITRKTRFKAAEVLTALGFKRIPYPNHGAENPVLTWRNRDGMCIAIQDDAIWTVHDFYARVRNQAAYRTRRRLKESIEAIEFGECGYIEDEKKGGE